MNRSLPLLLLAATPAHAEVTEKSDVGFATRNVVTVKASPADAFAALGKPSAWWNPAHSYTSDAKNMTLDMRAGGCFCESKPGGASVEHGRVVLVIPGSTLRLNSALGPLQAEGLTGSLSWDIKALPGGGSEITQTYVVGGFVRGGAGKYAGIVDQVVGEQLSRLKAYLDPR